MTTSSGEGSPPPAEGQLSRQQRLAAELRANLQRRKAKGRPLGGQDMADKSLRLKSKPVAGKT